MISRILVVAAVTAAAAFTTNGWGAKAAPIRGSVNEYLESDTPSYARRIVLSETDNYIDLKTGNVIRIHWDAANNNYVREDMVPLDIYVNSNSRDTFYGAQAILVNNAVIRDASGSYAIDPVWMSRNGDGIKARTANGDMKIKDNENELKMKEGDAKVKSNENELKMKEGNTKIKANENEYKSKDGDNKVKNNENELKMKSADGKVKENANEQKYKATDGTKVKSNDKETKIKTTDAKMKMNNRTGEMKSKPR